MTSNDGPESHYLPKRHGGEVTPKHRPLVTIVTVVLNGKATLEQTIKSVITQAYENKEYIIVDGGSTDGTLDIIKKYEKGLAGWLSEKDDGIVDAMNKGIKLATGDIIYFLNADDHLYNNEVLEMVVQEFEKDESVGLVCGLAEYFSDTIGVNYVDGRPMDYSLLYKGLPVSHQAIFFKKNLFDILGNYDLRYRIIADQEFVMRFFKRKTEHGQKDIFINKVISKVTLYGFNAKDMLKNLKESETVSDFYYPKTLSRFLFFKAKLVKYMIIILAIRTGIMSYYRRLKFNYLLPLFKRNFLDIATSSAAKGSQVSRKQPGEDR